MAIRIEQTPIEGVLILHPDRFGDARGFFSEVYRDDVMRTAGVDTRFTQDNHAKSATPGTLRGLHFQAPPFAQAKLVRVTRGAAIDVAVDIRKGSPTYGQHVAVELTEANWKQIYVPPGFAHGYITTAPDTEVLYKVDAPYAPDSEGGLPWNDPDLAIDWANPSTEPTISDRDRQWGPFATFESPF